MQTEIQRVVPSTAQRLLWTAVMDAIALRCSEGFFRLRLP